MKLANKAAVVTGAGAGIGQAVALLFASEGAHVFAVDIDEAGLKETEAKAPYGAKLSVMVVDVTKEETMRDALEAAAAQAGRLDILVNSAGIRVAGTVEETREDDWDRAIAINLRSVFLGCKYAVPLMKRHGGGVIINVASVAGMVGVKNRAAYSASKAGVIGLTKAMAVDHAADGIRVNCICPGPDDGPWLEEALEGSSGRNQALRPAAVQRVGRLGTLQEIAHAALYLAQDESASVHGTTLVIDGGYTAQ